MTPNRAKELLDTVTKSVIICNKCRLHKWRNKAVPGTGSHTAQIVFIGEAPGFNEDKEGLPFVGRAGSLLMQLLTENNVKRVEVWIGNIIKCRPPDNRDPMVDEIRACEPYLEKQIEIINPKVIVPLGRFAMAHFVKSGTISENHGKVFLIKNRLVLPLYHPAAALRNENVLKVLRQDFRIINKALNGQAEIVRIDKKQTNEDQMALI